MRRLLIAALVGTLLLAGCTGGGTSEAEGCPDRGSEDPLVPEGTSDEGDTDGVLSRDGPEIEDADTVWEPHPERRADYRLEPDDGSEFQIAGGSLTIEPCTIVEGALGIRVADADGHPDPGLIADGTAEDPVVFRGVEAEPGYWGGVIVRSEDEVRFDHTIIRHGGADTWGEWVNHGNGFYEGEDAEAGGNLVVGERGNARYDADVDVRWNSGASLDHASTGIWLNACKMLDLNLDAVTYEGFDNDEWNDGACYPRSNT